MSDQVRKAQLMVTPQFPAPGATGVATDPTTMATVSQVMDPVTACYTGTKVKTRIPTSLRSGAVTQLNHL